MAVKEARMDMQRTLSVGSPIEYKHAKNLVQMSAEGLVCFVGRLGLIED